MPQSPKRLKPLPHSKSKRARAAEARKLYQAARLKHKKTQPKQEWDSQQVSQDYQQILAAIDLYQRQEEFIAKKEAEYEAIYQAHVKEFPDSLDRPYNNCMYLLSDEYPQ